MSDGEARRWLDRTAALLEGVVRVSADGVPLEWNPRAAALLGSVDVARLAELGVPELLANGTEIADGQATVTGFDGRLRHLEHRTVVERDEHGTVTGATVALLDVTRDRARARALTEANGYFREVFSAATIGMAVLDRHGNIASTNPALAGLLGRDPLELVGLPFAGLAATPGVSALSSDIARLMDGHLTEFHSELPLVDRSGVEIWVQLDVTTLRDADNAPAYALVQVQDTTTRREQHAELQRLADHDALTGLLNRRGFARELERHLSHTARYGGQGALLVVDLDDFKRINDSLGHEAGDLVLCTVAAVLSDRVRDSDSLARMGGDEFAVLVPHGGAAAAEVLGRSLLEAMRAASPLDGVGIRITGSIGVAPFAGGETAEQVLAKADLAMYEAKQGGRDDVRQHVGDTRPVAADDDRVQAFARVREAVKEGRLRLLAQPICEPGTGRVELYELLLRMVDDRGGLLPPAAFLPIAERFDLVQDIDRWVVREACALLARHEGSFNISVNVSGKSLVGPGLVDALQSALEETGADPDRLVLELTETTAIAEIAHVKAFTARVRELGCRLAIDDFGAGYGSFQYLKHLPFDYLKIDGQFVVAGPESRTDALIVDAVRDLAHALGKRVIAEFVGDERLLEWATGRRLDLVQGFHIGRPLPIEDGLAEPCVA